MATYIDGCEFVSRVAIFCLAVLCIFRIDDACLLETLDARNVIMVPVGDVKRIQN